LPAPDCPIDTAVGAVRLLTLKNENEEYTAVLTI
jgi:hypothetical protein